MVEQRDRDAAADFVFGSAYQVAIRAGQYDHIEIVQAFARHREAERQAIVDWLRARAEVHRSQWAVSIDPLIAELADAIASGAFNQ